MNLLEKIIYRIKAVYLNVKYRYLLTNDYDYFICDIKKIDNSIIKNNTCIIDSYGNEFINIKDIKDYKNIIK